MEEPTLGIDLGGTKIEAVVLDGAGRTRWRRRRSTPRDDYAATLEALVALVAEAEAETGRRLAVGIGHPGAVDPVTGRIKNANSTWLNDRPFGRDLARRLARPVALANDADCLALSEATDGAGAGAAVVFAVILGTGVGGGIAVEGRVLAGPDAIAGEWGHNPLPWPEADEWPGPPCWCGLHGCIETWLSGPGLAADFARATGERLDARTIAARAAAGDGAARTVLDRHAHRLARALATVVNLLDPDVVVLGGGLSRLDHLYEAVPRLWTRWVFSPTVRTALRRARHGDSSGVRGAARLARLTRGAAHGEGARLRVTVAEP